MPSAPVFVGTSGFSYRHWRAGVFYPTGMPRKSELEFFARHFRTVELNNPFYRLPSKETFSAWRGRTPADFVFAVKASRFITHVKRLKDCAEPVARFMERAVGLGRKLGPILFQLPPDAEPDVERLDAFLGLLPKRRRFVFEFRSRDWFAPRVYDTLRRRRVALCLAVSPTMPDPPLLVTARFSYIRMHAGSADGGEFSEEELRQWAVKIDQLRGDGIPVYVYFNNDWRGFALRNALRLRELLEVAR